MFSHTLLQACISSPYKSPHIAHHRIMANLVTMLTRPYNTAREGQHRD